MNRPIGVIDSGVGGLTVMRELIHQLPNENFIYLGDTKRCPYGSRPKEEVKKFTWEMVNFLLDKNIKMLIIACNTATAFTLSELEEKLDIPVMGVIQPGARAAAKRSKNNSIGVIATEGTIKSNMYTKALQKINSEVRVSPLACPLFVPLIEHGNLSGVEITQVIEQTLLPLKENEDIDTLILGCTHYPIIKDKIQHFIGSDVLLVSSGEETAKDTRRILETIGIERQENTLPSYQIYTTDKSETFIRTAYKIFIRLIDNLQTVSIETVNFKKHYI